MATAVLDGEVAQPQRRLRLPDHLPDLRGRWLTLYTIAWAIFLALAIVRPIRSQYQTSGYYQKPVWLPYGFAATSVSGFEIEPYRPMRRAVSASGPATGSLPLMAGKQPPPPTHLRVRTRSNESATASQAG